MSIKGHFEAKKHAIRQTADGWVVSFVIHPDDMTNEFAGCPLGTHFQLGYAQIVEGDEPETPKPKQRFEDMSRAQQAGILCGDPEFWKFLDVDHQRAAEIEVRSECMIQSRSELNRSDRAESRAAWDDLVRQFRGFQVSQQHKDNLAREAAR